MLLLSRRLRLEPVAAAQAQHLAEDLLDRRLYRHLDGEPPSDVAGVQAWLLQLANDDRRSQSQPGATRWMHWVSRRRCAYVGLVEVSVEPEGRAEIGFITFTRFWRRGYGREAVQRVMAYLQEVQGVGEIVARTTAGNVAAQRLLQQLGMRRLSPSCAGAPGGQAQIWTSSLQPG